MQKEYSDVSDLKLWDRNPRAITQKSFIRLKKHLILILVKR